MTRHWLALLSAALTAFCVVPYLRDIRRGTTHPQRASWLVVAVVAVVATVSQGLAGADAGTWLSAGSAVGFTAVFVASIRHGVGGLAAIDCFVLGVALTGVIVSVAADDPLLAVVAIVVAEVVAIALTARKAFLDPGSETTATWRLDLAAGVAAIAAVERASVTNLLYPVHHTVANATVVIAIMIGTRRARLIGRTDPSTVPDLSPG
jgi:hypothetical protein